MTEFLKMSTIIQKTDKFSPMPFFFNIWRYLFVELKSCCFLFYLKECWLKFQCWVSVFLEPWNVRKDLWKKNQLHKESYVRVLHYVCKLNNFHVFYFFLYLHGCFLIIYCNCVCHFHSNHFLMYSNYLSSIFYLYFFNDLILDM